MGVEVGNSDGFEVAPAPFEPVTHSETVNADKVSIKFGSQDEPVIGEEQPKFSSDVPKDATEEWPAPKQIHTFYFVRYRPYEDPKIKAKLDQTDKELQKMNRTRAGIVDELKAKRAERSELFNQLNPLKSERKGFNDIFDEKKKEMEPLQQALGKLRSNDGGGRGISLCSSEEELNDLIYSLQYRIQHESISLNEEKQILKEIKQLEGTRDKVVANSAMRAKIKESLGQKEDLQDQVKLMGSNLDGVRKERQAITAKINQLSEKLNTGKDEIQVLENELKVVSEKRDKVFANLQELRKQRDDTNANFYQSRTVLIKSRELAANKNVQDLKALAHTEVEKFMSFWSSKKNFRDDYEKRILSSLDARQLSRDGRIRNPDEKPLVAPEAPQRASALPLETKDVPKAKAKQTKEETNSALKQDEKAQKESGNKIKDTEKVKDNKSSSEGKAVDEDFYVPVKPQKDEKKVDEAKLKEMKKQEEAAKAKLALERKRKLAEKAAAKAAIRAQKEAEKKEKEREKKAKKKAAIKSTLETDAAAEEEVVEASDPEKNEVEAEVPEKPEKERALKEKPVRQRNRGKGPEALPRAILKRRKSTNYWAYAAPAALAVVLLLALAYYCLL